MFWNSCFGIRIRLMFLIIFLSDIMHLTNFLCSFLINVIFRASGNDKMFSYNTLHLQNLSIFMATCGKFFYFCCKIFIFLWQNLGFQMAIFHDASKMQHSNHLQWTQPIPTLQIRITHTFSPKLFGSII